MSDFMDSLGPQDPWERSYEIPVADGSVSVGFGRGADDMTHLVELSIWSDHTHFSIAELSHVGLRKFGELLIAFAERLEREG